MPSRDLAEWFVTGNVPPPTMGTITVTVSGSSVQLSGKGNGWSVVDGEYSQIIHLKPASDSTVLYQLTLKLVQPPQQQTLSFVGVQLLRASESEASQKAAIFIQASGDQAQVNLLNQIPKGGGKVIYEMGIGLFDGTNTSWHYPTISFEPDGPPAP